MTDNIKKLLDLASGNAELASKLSNASKDEFIAIAKEQGIALTEADFAPTGEIPEDDLKAVTGGIDMVAFRGNWIIADMNSRKYNQH